MKTLPLETELINADGQTDMTKVTVAFFNNCANVPKNVQSDQNSVYMFIKFVP